MADPAPRDFSRLEDILRRERDLELGRKAVERGFLSQEQLEEALRDARALALVLADRGWMSPEAQERLAAELARDDFARSSLSPGDDVPAEAKEAAGDPNRQIAEFLLVSPLGRGGAAEVWKAWDRQLRRWVAVKLPHFLADLRLPLERFQREASAVAKLSHPNIVPLYRAGVDRGRPYLVFQFVEGRSLEGAKLSSGEAVETVRIAALAVDYAHRQGIVHRDLKPGNLMLDSQGRVWVLDFGLAFLGGEEGRLTATGAAIGTPCFMSPEQARGEAGAHQPATDVYSLGATLFDLATGRPPFDGKNFVEIVHRVARDDPPRPRAIKPELSERLETIIQKAMTREPERRYSSAAEFAEDLRRFRTGEEISARPTSLVYRFARTVRRRAASVSLAAAIALGALLAAFLYSRVENERRAALSTVRDTARVSLEAALELRRNGQNSGMRRFLEPLEKAYRSAVERAPNLAEPDYLLGRLYRALLDERSALAAQERALAKEPDYAPSRYERAVLLSREYGRQYRKAAESVRALGPGRAGSVERDAVERTNPALAPLRETIRRDLEALAQTNDDRALAARGILAYTEDRTAEARTLLEQAVAKNPRAEEAWEAWAGAVAVEAQRARGLEAKEELWRESEDLYDRALGEDQGYLPHLMGRGEVCLQRAKLIRQYGRDPLRDLDLAEKDFSRAIEIDPAWTEAWIRRGESRASRAIHEGDAGREPFDHHARAEKDLSRAIELDPSAPEAWMRRGLVRTNRAVYRGERRQDGRADFDAADSDFTKALALDPAYADAWHWRGIGRANRGMSQMRKDEDPMPSFDQAEEDLGQALRLRADAPGIWLWRGILENWRAQALRKRASDASAVVLLAERHYGRALELNPDYADAYFWRGLLRRRDSGGEKPAEDDFGQVIRINPNHWEARIQRADLRIRRADALAGTDAKAEYQAAALDLREAIRINPAAKVRVQGLLERAEKKAAP